MKIKNVHRRVLNQPKEKIIELFKTLSTENDKIWPFEKWPKMKFKHGIKEESRGGHGPIRYTIEKYDKNNFIQFRFSKPSGFNGIHKFEIIELEREKTELKHIIEMDTVGKGLLIWFLAIRSLHNALIEDALDKVENQFSEEQKKTEWNIWVKILRRIMKTKRSK